MDAPRVFLALCVSTLLAGCPVGFLGTPKDELRNMGARIETFEDRSVRLSLRGKKASTGDLMIAMALCSNHSDEYSALRELDLSRSSVTDQGLRHLQLNATTISSLRILDLRGTRVSDEAVADLQAALPDCQVLR